MYSDGEKRRKEGENVVVGLEGVRRREGERRSKLKGNARRGGADSFGMKPSETTTTTSTTTTSTTTITWSRRPGARGNRNETTASTTDRRREGEERRGHEPNRAEGPRNYGRTCCS